MEYKGIAKGNIIELEKPLPFEDGTKIEISIKLMPKPRKGSPKAILQLEH